MEIDRILFLSEIDLLMTAVMDYNFFLEIVYKNVRKANLPLTANIAYCEIRITELMATLEAI